MSAAKPSVLIIGGGIVGMSTAPSLARIGVPVTLLEQSPQIGEIGAGLQLGPNAFAALDALGWRDRRRADCSHTHQIPREINRRRGFNEIEMASLLKSLT
jgi:salicylate hydroxylase